MYRVKYRCAMGGQAIRLFALGVIAGLSLAASAQTITITNGVQKYGSLTSTSVTMSGRCELWVTNSSPLSSCLINLNSADAWLFLPGVKPSVVASSYLGQIRVNGAVAVADSNLRIVQYGQSGAVVIPHASTFQPLTVFSDLQFLGSSTGLAQWTNYTGAAVPRFSSFKLKRGYQAVFAQSADGKNYSKCYIAQDGDLEVGVLPATLDKQVKFVYVTPWRWTSKKGISGDPGLGLLNLLWWYNWNISSSSSRDLEYVAIRQTQGWPPLAQNWQSLAINTVLGYNEPDSSSQANLSVGAALSSWPDLLATGLRVGSPATTDGGRSGWQYPFVQQADAAGLRVDFVAVHYYWAWNPADPAGAANQMYNFLLDIWNNTHRPIWITEWNNGANWTDNNPYPPPTYAQQQACISAMQQMLESTKFVERYALYNWVEDARSVVTNNAATPAGVSYSNQVSTLSYSQTMPDNGTRAFAQYLFETNAQDSSGYANNGMMVGAPAFTNGNHGQAIVLDGTNSYVQLPQNLGKGSAFTFAAWVKWGGGPNWQRIFDLGNDTSHYLFLTPSSGGGTLRFAINNGSGEQIVESGALTSGSWQHVCVTVNGATAKLYKDGALAATATNFSIAPASFNPVFNYLGKSQFPANPLFKGALDDVLFADYSLSAAQVAALVTNSAPQFANRSLARSAAGCGFLYSDTLAGAATDANLNDTLTYTKLAGPSWLSVSAGGYLGGLPGIADLGTNSFTVQVSDSAGMTASAQLSIVVTNPPKMIARYEFDGTAASSVGNAHGVITGPANYVPGHSGQAIDLDGATNYITLPAGVVSSDDFSIAAWVNWDGGPAWQRIFDFGNGTSDYMFLTPGSGSGTMRFGISVAGGAEQQLNASALPSGSWQHVIVTRTGNIGRMFLNGNQVAIAGISFKPSSFNPALNYIGKSQFPGDPRFNGRVDSFCIYNYGLSTAQAAALYTNAPPGFVVNPLATSNAIPSRLYAGSIAGTATNAGGGAMTYAKIAGPGWLKLNGDGTFSGYAGKANVGPNGFAVRATDTFSLSAEAMLYVNIAPGPDAIGVFGFENGTTNSVGGNHGTPSGALTYVPGVNGLALGLDGAHDYVTLPANILNVNNLTIAAWVQWNGGAAWQRIFDFGSGTAQYMFLTPNSGNGTLRFAITTAGNGNEQRLECSPMPTNQWTHVAVVLQGGASGKLYVNGSLMSSNSITILPSSIPALLNYLGKSQFSGDPLLNARLDDFQIYNRALSPFELACLANPNRDSDGDGLTDTAETDADMDGDGIPNYLDLDADGDGMPDAWEVAYGLNPFNPSDANGDLDGDGQSNLQEYIAGTEPNNAASVFTQAVVPGPPFSVSVPGVAGRTYVLWRSPFPTGPWTPVGTNGSVGSSAPVFLTDSSPPGSGAFYRTSVSQ
jgi:putative hemolysin